MREEVKNIRKRIDKLQLEISNFEMVQDSVKGTRKDGTNGSIRITGYPTQLFWKKKDSIKRCRIKLELAEMELLELMNDSEEFIQSIEKSELRSMFRFYYIDGMSWQQVAINMNDLYPNRRIAFTDSNCQKRNIRFFENVHQCPIQM